MAVSAEETSDGSGESGLPDFAGGDYTEGLVGGKQGEGGEDGGLEDAEDILAGAGGGVGGGGGEEGGFGLEEGDEGMVGVTSYEESIVMGKKWEEMGEAVFCGFGGVVWVVDRRNAGLGTREVCGFQQR